jgi:hypothetical protein
VRHSRTARIQSELVKADSRRLAELIAATEDKLAATLVWVAERRPRRADQLRQLSEHARAEARHMRRIADRFGAMTVHVLGHLGDIAGSVRSLTALPAPCRRRLQS